MPLARRGWQPSKKTTPRPRSSRRGASGTAKRWLALIAYGISGARRRPVHLGHVLLDHAARREARHVGSDRLAHDRDPSPRQAAAAAVAIVERRYDLVLEQ